MASMSYLHRKKDDNLNNINRDSMMKKALEEVLSQSVVKEHTKFMYFTLINAITEPAIFA